MLFILLFSIIQQQIRTMLFFLGKGLWLNKHFQYFHALLLINQSIHKQAHAMNCEYPIQAAWPHYNKILIIINVQMYENMEQQETTWMKIQRNGYLIVTITLLTHTMSITYSMMSFKQQSAGFISIIISSLVCFFMSASHLTIYGISILGILYLKILQPYYSRSQIHYVVALSGIIVFSSRRIIQYVSKIFDSYPGRVHGSMLFGTALITLFKFFPLSIENIQAFFAAASSNALVNIWEIISLTFRQFNVLTLLLTIICIILLYLLRNKLLKVPFIGVLVLLGILINTQNVFESYQQLCSFPNVDCKFYIVKLQNMIPPSIEKLISMIPSAAVMTTIIIFQQFLYLQQFQRRRKRHFGEGDLGSTENQLKVLALTNLISGCLGGLPICINLFATYQNFSFNIRSGFKGTKLVGLMQIPVSYAFYSVLRWLYQMIPLFVLFVIVATPAVYFLSNIFKINYRHLTFITLLAALNVVTHPIIALILSSLISMHDISQLLKSVPAQILIQDVDGQGSRRSSTVIQIIQKKQSIEQKVSNLSSEFAKRIIQIQTDQPEQFCNSSYILYRFTGPVSYLNYFEHIEQINKLIDTYMKKQIIPLLLSFRYSQIIDEQSLQELAIYVEKLNKQKQIQVIFTGLHRKLIREMQKIKYFQLMLRTNEKSMYRLDQAE